MIPSCPRIEISFNEFFELNLAVAHMVPGLYYISHKPSQGFDPVEKTLASLSVDNALRAKGILVLRLHAAPKKEGDRHSHFTQKELLSDLLYTLQELHM